MIKLGARSSHLRIRNPNLTVYTHLPRQRIISFPILSIRRMSNVHLKAAEDFLSFVNASPTPFHAVRSAKLKLEKAGFKQIKERDPWSSTLKPGGKYYLTRNGSTLVAFAIGSQWKAGNPIAMVGAHTDSPCLRIKPVSKRQADGFLQVGVETYGGGLWHTWFDRDLSVAGRVIVKTKEGNFESRLVRVNRPILRIPTLAIHLERQDNFQPNKETHLFPICGLVAAELNRTGKSETDRAAEKLEDTKLESESAYEPLKLVTERHHPYIIDLLAEEAKCTPAEIQDFEIVLYDTQPSCIGGMNNEFIFSPRLDNLMMSYCATESIIHSLSSSDALAKDPTIRLIALFDHEEIGSTTAQGADSDMLPSVIRRLSCINGSGGSEASYDKMEENSTAYEQTLASSFLISADMAHSVHPNYPAKYESSHRPEMNKGTVIKVNANNRYATNSPGMVLLQESARRAKSGSYPSAVTGTKKQDSGVPLQLFVVRNDSSCGSTIGPMLAAKLGARTLDLGNPQLSMHSIRETGGAYDVEYAVNLFESFFTHYGELESKFLVD
jgi:aspartyl aminopeptidase